MAAPSAPAEPTLRLTSRDYHTWIWPRPKVAYPFLGYIRVGRSVALRSPDLVRGEGCHGGFYAVAPRGYVCRDRTVTIELEPWRAELHAASNSIAGPFPYRYAISDGAPMYNRIPTPAEQTRFERRYGPVGKALKLPKSMRSHEELAVAEPIPSTGPLPSFLSSGSDRPKPLALLRQSIPLGSMLSFTRAFEAEGRTWLLSADETIVPADRTRPFKPSAFKGVRLGGEVKLPIAWMRRTAQAQYRKVAGGEGLEKTGATWPVRTFVRLTGASVEHSGVRYLETTDREGTSPGQAGGGAPTGQSLYIAEIDATVAQPEAKLPFGVAAGQKWMLIRITDGTLIAYEDMKPVYATLISPGAGGVPIKGQDPVKMSTTPVGTYYVTFKDRAATMSPEKGDNRKFWIADVPHTQYFNPPFAVHAAYWHERFGEPVSAGCVNLSPIDAEAMFQWSDPQVPEGWQGATGSGAKENGPTTAIVVWR